MALQDSGAPIVLPTKRRMSLPSNIAPPASSHISAQDLIKLKSAVVMHGILRFKGKSGLGLNFGRWPTRFVVLVRESLYVFDSETSKSTKRVFPLLGYNCVKRMQRKGHELAFSILPTASSLKTITFCCMTDTDRKKWMRCIRDQIHTANNIEPKMMNRFKEMSITQTDEEEYEALEEPVFKPDEIEMEETCTDSSDEDFYDTSDSESNPSEGSTANIQQPRRLSEQDAYPDKNELCAASDPITMSASNNLPHAGNKQAELPPRYSSVLRNESTEDTNVYEGEYTGDTNVYEGEYTGDTNVYEDEPNVDDPLYVNTRQAQKMMSEDLYEVPSLEAPTLEQQCIITDHSADRDELLKSLRKKDRPGTYLIRKSRTGDLNVLSYLSADGQVREYKILEMEEFHPITKYSLDKSRHFDILEDLLTCYTHEEPLPKSDNEFLKFGFFSP